MKTTPEEKRRACQEHLERFFVNHPELIVARAAMKALRFLAVSDLVMEGKLSRLAAGCVNRVPDPNGASACSYT